MKRLSLALAGALLALVAAVSPVSAHDVKDPVCRMTVDSDTAKWKHKLGNKSYYFCSKQCQASFVKSPRKYETLAEQLEKQDLHQYTVDLTTREAPMAGQPVQLELAVRYADSKAPVREFERIHERLFHLIMVSEDLSWFEHQHPTRVADGVFRIAWTFPRAGKYRLYADFTPADGDNQVLPLSLTVAGGGAKTVALSPDSKRVKQIGDLRFELALQGEPVRMEKPLLLTYTIRDRQGRLVRNLQPFIGAMGHLLAISQDGKEVVHTHSLQSASQPAMGGEKEPFRVTPAMVTEKGPRQSFKLTLPTGGLYKTWAQFMHGNRVYTVPFTFLAQDLWTTAPAAKAAPAAADGVQRATVIIDGEYLPAQVQARAGRPLELTFIRKEKGGCGDVVQIPGLGFKKTLRPGERAVVRVTPRKTGTLAFTCGMKMYKGRIAVR